MSMLLDDREVALNEVVRSLRVAALRHRDAADRVEDRSFAEWLAATADRRDRLASEIVANWPHHPGGRRNPDADAEFIHALVSRLHAALAPRSDTALAEESRADEQEIERCLGQTEGFEIMAPLADLLAAARSDVAAAIAALDERIGDSTRSG